MDQYNHSNIDVIILCGGAGTRFRAVSSDKPKTMADINGKPFLDVLLDYYLTRGFEKFILCIGHLADYIKNYYKNSIFSKYITYSEEKSPLGTGGAIKNAEPFISCKNFLVINGDSFCDINPHNLLDFHMQKKGSLISIGLTAADDRRDTGNIEINKASSLITAFQEKINTEKKLFINTGIYAFKKIALNMIPANSNFSLEFSLFPKIAEKNGLYGFITDKKLIDIGTPERYQEAKTFFQDFSCV